MSCHYICKTCGEDFNEAEIRHGACPNCESDDIFEAEICANCHEWKIADDMIEGVCPDCAEAILDSYRYEPAKIYHVMEDDTESVELNCFLAANFSKAEIEDILLKELLSVYGRYDWFIRSDKSWFLERVKEKGELCKEETEQTA